MHSKALPGHPEQGSPWRSNPRFYQFLLKARQGVSSLCGARLGEAWLGEARPSKAFTGDAMRGSATLSWAQQGDALLGEVRHSMARLSKAIQGFTNFSRRGNAPHCLAVLGMSRLSEATQGKAFFHLNQRTKYDIKHYDRRNYPIAVEQVL